MGNSLKILYLYEHREVFIARESDDAGVLGSNDLSARHCVGPDNAGTIELFSQEFLISTSEEIQQFRDPIYTAYMFGNDHLD